MVLIKMVVIHPQSELDCIKYSKVVKSLMLDTINNKYDIVLFCKTEFTSLLYFLYQDILLSLRFVFDDVYTVPALRTTIITDTYRGYIRKGYGEFDVLRDDDNTGVFGINFSPVAFPYAAIVALYSEDTFKPEYVSDSTRPQIIINRNLVLESSMTKKLKNYFSLPFVSISDDKFRKYVFNNETNSVNFNKLFPAIRNNYNFIQLCLRAKSFIVSNDQIGRLIFTLQTKLINGRILLSERVKVLFHLESGVTKAVFLANNPFFANPPASWTFGSYIM